MPRRIAIHAGHVIAFDGRGHRLLRDGVVILDPHEFPELEHKAQRVDPIAEREIKTVSRFLRSAREVEATVPPRIQTFTC